MARSQNNDLAEDLAASLKSTTLLIQTLLGEIKENGTSLALLKYKLEEMNEKVESLTVIVSKGNGKESMVTRLALLEDDLGDLEEVLKEYKGALSKLDAEKKTESGVVALDKKKSIETLKAAAVIAPGVIALILVIIQTLAKAF